MPTSAITQFSASPLQPAFPKPDPIWESFQFGVSQTILKGTVVAQKVSDGKIYPYVASTLVATPAAPAITNAGAGGTWPAGTYSVAISYVNPQGETKTSVPVLVTVTAGQNIQVPAIAGIDSTVTSVNVYVNGFLAANIAVAAQATVQTNIANYGASSGVPLAVSTAKKVVDGTQIAFGLMPFDVTTDASGNVYPGQQASSEFGQSYPNAPVFLYGYFSCADLTGLDANAVSQFGKLVVGTTAAGILFIR